MLIGSYMVYLKAFFIHTPTLETIRNSLIIKVYGTNISSEPYNPSRPLASVPSHRSSPGSSPDHGYHVTRNLRAALHDGTTALYRTLYTRRNET